MSGFGKKLFKTGVAIASIPTVVGVVSGVRESVDYISDNWATPVKCVRETFWNVFEEVVSVNSDVIRTIHSMAVNRC